MVYFILSYLLAVKFELLNFRAHRALFHTTFWMQPASLNPGSHSFLFLNDDWFRIDLLRRWLAQIVIYVCRLIRHVLQFRTSTICVLFISFLMWCIFLKCSVGCFGCGIIDWLRISGPHRVMPIEDRRSHWSIWNCSYRWLAQTQF